LSVAYTPKRGEPRGPRKPGDDYKEMGLGDCIDCSWCVQVCPVDIDIRDGLQAECIDCGLCVDACNTVMDKMQYPRGLISFTTEDAIETGHTRVLRPRLVGYLAILLVMIGVFVHSISSRLPVGLEVLRDRGVRMYRISGETVQNVYTLKINNLDRGEHTYDVSVSGDYPFELQGYRALPVAEGETLTIPVRVAVVRDDLTDVKTAVTIRIQSRANPEITAEHSTTFIGPQPRGQ
jgi:cytochrome c oxidase accessory protein FixG